MTVHLITSHITSLKETWGTFEKRHEVAILIKKYQICFFLSWNHQCRLWNFPLMFVHWRNSNFHSSMMSWLITEARWTESPAPCTETRTHPGPYRSSTTWVTGLPHTRHSTTEPTLRTTSWAAPSATHSRETRTKSTGADTAANIIIIIINVQICVIEKGVSYYCLSAISLWTVSSKFRKLNIFSQCTCCSSCWARFWVSTGSWRRTDEILSVY